MFVFRITILPLLVSIFAFSQPPSNDAQVGRPGGSCGKKVEKAEKKEAKVAEKGKSMSLTGWVKDQDGKTAFVNDKATQSWDISNTDAVKGHEGHHVKVKAKLNEADHSVNVEKVTMLRKGKQTAEEQMEDKKK